MIRARRKPSIPIYTVHIIFRRFFWQVQYMCVLFWQSNMHTTYWSIIRYRGDRESNGEEKERQIQTDFKSGGGGGGRGVGEDNWTCVWSPCYSVEDDYTKMSLFCVGHTVTTEAETHVCKLYGAMRGCGSGSGFARICKVWAARHVQTADPDPIGYTMGFLKKFIFIISSGIRQCEPPNPEPIFCNMLDNL